MPPFKQVNADDNERDNAEVTGSANLAEVLEERGIIRGTFSINGHEFRDFVAQSPKAVVDGINAAQQRTGVTASIDDEYHLVLESNSPDEIAIASGFGADRDRERMARIHRDSGKSQAEVDLVEAKQQEIDEKDGGPKDVLELLGLEATTDLNRKRGGAEWAPGQTQEERHKAKEARAEYERTGVCPEGYDASKAGADRLGGLPSPGAVGTQSATGISASGSPSADPNASAPAIDKNIGPGGTLPPHQGAPNLNRPERQGEAPGQSPATTESPSL